MIPYEEMEYHPITERITNIMCEKIGSNSPFFFRPIIGYYFAVAASSMRCNIRTPDRGLIPVNTYAMGLGPSGVGKTRATNIMKKDVLSEFIYKFKNETFLLKAQEHIPTIAYKRAQTKSTDPDDELKATEKEFHNTCGQLMMNFDSGSAPALKQLRHKLQIAKAGSLNLEVDEIADNVRDLHEMMSVFLELWDVGITGEKLTKNTRDNFRVEPVGGRTPANALLYGTPTGLLDNGAIEKQFMTQLEQGQARRFIFGYAASANTINEKDPEDVLKERMNSNSDQYINNLSQHFEKLANIINMDQELQVSQEVAIENIRYEQDCRKRADQLNEYESIRATEFKHRADKAMKLAGAYAFVDQSPEITTEHLYAAIKITEDSGEALKSILTREQDHVKLARYIAESDQELTHPDLLKHLPFYPKAASPRNEIMQLAIAWGYQNNILIKNRFQDKVEFIWGETLEKTDLDKMILSYSNDMAKDYEPVKVKWDDLAQLAQVSGMHWVNHAMANGYRNEDNAIPGFNLMVIDVDGQISIESARSLLENYKYFLYTTKRHTPETHRFRLLFPTNYVLELNAEDYKEFMGNVFEWLPFEVDESTDYRCKKWLTNDGYYEFNEGDCLDVLPFIPSTSRNKNHKKEITYLRDQQSLDNLERWVIRTAEDGNTNNQLIKYALVLVDADFTYNEIYSRVKDLNSKLFKSLSDIELLNTIMATVNKKLNAQPA